MVVGEKRLGSLDDARTFKYSKPASTEDQSATNSAKQLASPLEKFDPKFLSDKYPMSSPPARYGYIPDKSLTSCPKRPLPGLRSLRPGVRAHGE